jgi:hypothetical protein
LGEVTVQPGFAAICWKTVHRRLPSLMSRAPA